jgi:hypothetical protein
MGRESQETGQGSVPDAIALLSNSADQKAEVGAAVGVCVMVVMI